MNDWIAICLLLLIFVFGMLIGFRQSEKIVYQDKIIQPICMINCTETTDKIVCYLPNNKQLEMYKSWQTVIR
jgi:hypothetical protein